tara:strand:- start:181 stop:378 length:198 start_codon:yes stop_codon:yes gene_type:complete
MVEQMIPPDPTDYFSAAEMDYMMAMIEEYEIEMFRLQVKHRLQEMSKADLERNMLDIYGDNWKNI